MSNVKGQGFEFSNGYTYLMLKAEEGNFEEVQKILADLQQPNINALNRNGSTALSLAAKNGSYGIVEALVQAGADVNIKNSSGQSPLFLACWNNFRDIVKLLLQNNAEINTKDQRGWTPLMIAAYNSHKEIVKLLIDKNADVTIRDCFDKTALDRSKDSYIIKMLQEAAEVGQEYEEKNEDQTQETKPEQHSFTPEQPNSKEQLHSILKKSGTKRDEYSRYADDDYVKVQDFNSQPNHTTASSIYHYQRPQEQRGYERRLHSPGKQDISTLHNDSRVSRDYNPLESRKASDPKLSTRFSRPRHDRHNYSMDRSYQLSSRSPAKSTMLTARNQKTTPLRSRDTVRSMTSPLSEAKRQNLKEDIQHDISTEVSSVSGRIKDIIQQKIALEVPQHMQSFEQTLGKELNTAFQFRMDSIFKSLHASFNLKVKFCLNKLGFDTAGLSLAPFTDEEILYKPNEKPFVDQVPKYNYEKEAKAIEKDISRLEKSVLSKSLLDRSMHSEINGDRHHHHHQDCVHTSFAARTQIKTELSEQLGQDVRSTTEYLVGFSNGKINEVVRNETSQIHQKMLDALTRSLDTVEDDFRRKFEEFINKKVNDLAASLTGSSHQVLVSSKKISPDLTPSKQLFSSKTSEKKITFNQESERPVQPEKPNASMDFVKTILKSPESQYSHKSSTSAYKEKDFAQTKGKIEKLKNSLNFIDDAIPSLGSEKNDESYRDNQKEVRRELHYHQLEAGDSSVRDISQGNLIRSSLLSERPEFTDSSKRELNDNIQVASKMDEIRKFYQNRYGNM